MFRSEENNSSSFHKNKKKIKFRPSVRRHVRRKCWGGKRRGKRADDNGKSRKSVGCGSDPIGREQPGANQISRNLLLFGIEGSRRKGERRRGVRLVSHLARKKKKQLLSNKSRRGFFFFFFSISKIPKRGKKTKRKNAGTTPSAVMQWSSRAAHTLWLP